MFELKTDFLPQGDQPKAIAALVEGFKANKKAQVLLGVTGSGKTFTMANVVQQIQKPTLVLAHNKTLAAQLYQEFKAFFPTNAIEYFVSYYDYYQPEAYIPRTDTYIEKDLAINDRIERMRLSATRSLLSRSDVLIVASVSCIYGLGSPEYYSKMLLSLAVKQKVRRDEVLMHLVEMHYTRSDYELSRGVFRVRGDVLEIVPAYEDDIAYRIEFFGDEVERLSEINPLSGKVRTRLDKVDIYPGSHFVTPEQVRLTGMEAIRQELKERVAFFESENRLIEAQRIRERTMHDLELIKEVGFCKGIENYSLHFSGRQSNQRPHCLIDYFPDDFLFFIDESHQTLPQIHAMYNGDRARKEALVEFGFRLPSAFGNRPLKFEEAYTKFHQMLYVSATPGPWEVEETGREVVEQIIRPTGLLDPAITVRPATGQVDDALEEIRQETERGGKVLVTTLTKKLSEDLAQYLQDLGVKAKFLHSELDTLERMKILKALRLGEFDVLVGINLLREGLDLPEVTCVVILDADKEGFLRSETALIQTCGRAARNVRGRVIFYADKETKAIKQAIATTTQRRRIQQAYNEQHNITPQTTKREQKETLEETFGLAKLDLETANPSVPLELASLEKKIRDIEKKMKLAAKELKFDEAARLRDLMRELQNLEMFKSEPS